MLYYIHKETNVHNFSMQKTKKIALLRLNLLTILNIKGVCNHLHYSVL